MKRPSGPGASCRQSRTSRNTTVYHVTRSGTPSSSSLRLDLVETRPGQGTFVVPPDRSLRHHPDRRSDRRRRRRRRNQLCIRSREGGPDSRPSARSRSRSRRPRPDVAAGLWVPIGTEVISRHRKRYIDGKAWSLETSFYPGEFADRGAARLRKAGDIEEGTVRYLQKDDRHPPGRLPRLDRRTRTKPGRNGLLQAAAGRASQRGRDIPAPPLTETSGRYASPLPSSGLTGISSSSMSGRSRRPRTLSIWASHDASNAACPC